MDDCIEAIDICPYCDTENYFTTENGYIGRCRNCGREMMMCDACGHCDEEGNWIRDECDWHFEGEYSVCHRGKIKEK